MSKRKKVFVVEQFGTSKGCAECELCDNATERSECDVTDKITSDFMCGQTTALRIVEDYEQ